MNCTNRVRAYCLVLLVIAGNGSLAWADDITVYNQLGERWLTLQKTGQMDEALAVAQRILEISRRSVPDDEAMCLVRVGMSYLGQGQYREAIDWYSQALDTAYKSRPTSQRSQMHKQYAITDALVSMGSCYSSLEEHEEAIKWLKQAIEWDQRIKNVPQESKAIGLLGGVYFSMGDYKNAHAMYGQNVAICERLHAQKVEDRPGLAGFSLAGALHNWARVYIQQGRYDLAESKIKRAIPLAARYTGPQSASIANMCNTLATLYYKEGRIDEAEPLYRYSLSIYEKTVGLDHPHAALVRHSLAHSLRLQGKIAEAEAMLQEIITGLESYLGPKHPYLTGPLMSRGRCLVSLGRAEEAEKLFQRALAINEEGLGPAHLHTAEAGYYLAMATGILGREQEGFARTDGILKNHQVSPLPAELLAQIYHFRAIHLWHTEKKDAALAELQKALDAAQEQRWFASGAERERASLFATYSDDFEVMVQWQAELGRADQVFHAIESVKARTFLEEMEVKGVDLLAGLPEGERRQLQEREAELRGQLSAAEHRLQELPDPTPKDNEQSIAERRRVAEQVLRLRQSLYEHVTEMRKASPTWRQLMSADRKAVTLSNVQKSLLRDGDLLLLYKIGDETSHVMAIRANAVSVQPLRVDESAGEALGIETGWLTADKLAQVLLDNKTGVVARLSRPKGQGSNLAELAVLWRLLIPESERASLLNGDVKLLTVVPDGPLALLPFETLIVADPAEPQFLLDAGPPIAYGPSTTVLLNLAQAERIETRDREPIFTLGDPAYPAAAPGGQFADRSLNPLAVRSASERFRSGLNRLPYTGWESQWVAECFEKQGIHAVRVSGGQATEAAIRQHAPGREIVHLACHGMADQTYGNFFGTLAIAPGKAGDPRDDGFLSMSEIYGLNLSGCELAILSACETNYGPQQQGEGVWALSRGFLVAGARRVVASNWVVDDQAGATLVSYFATYLSRAGQDRSARDYAKALHDAKKQVRKEEKWASPFYWSSLVLVGPK